MGRFKTLVQLKKHWNWLKWVVAASVVAYLLVRHRAEFSQLADRQISYGFLGIALALCAASIILTFVRWYLLVWAQEFPFRVSDALRLGFIGYLFNYVSVGAAGGDLVRAVMLAKEQSSRRAVAVATILLDRLLGVLALFMVGAAAALFTQSLWKATEVKIIIGVLTGGSVVGCLGLALLLHSSITRWRPVQALTRLPVIGRILADIIEGIGLYQTRPRVLWLAVGMSVVGHLGMLSSFYFCAQALQSGAAAPGYFQHLLLIPGAELASVVVPLPGGLGALEAAIKFSYELVNRIAGFPVTAAQAGAAGLLTALAYRVVCVIIATVGAGYYLSARRQIDTALHEPQADAETDSTTKSIASSPAPSTTQQGLIPG